MALGQIPPWLNVGPTDYLHAVQAGTQAGLEVARLRSAAQEAAARRALAQEEAQRKAWEFGENLRQQAQIAQIENERQGQYQQGTLDWHREQMRLDAEKAARGDAEAQARIDETMRHNLATEAQAKAEAERGVMPTEANLDPTKYYVTKGGAVIRPQAKTGLVSPNSAFNAVVDPAKWAMAQVMFGPESTNLMNIAKSGFMPPQAGTIPTNAVPQMGTNQPSANVESLKSQAMAAIAAGAPRDAVRARFREMTGQELD